MSARGLRTRLFMTPEQVAALFPDGMSGTKTVKWVYRHSGPRGFLYPAARHFGRALFFSRVELAQLLDIDKSALGESANGDL